MKKLGLVLLTLATGAYASQDAAHQAGHGFAQGLRNEASQNLKQIDKSQVPGYQTDNPPQSALSNGGDFNSAINTELRGNEAGQSLMDISKQRQSFNLDVNSDALFNQKENANAETTLGISTEQAKLEKDVPKIVTCEEGGEGIDHDCYVNREVIPQVPIKTVTLAVNHLNFKANMESYSVQVKGGKWYRHGKWETRQRQKGWTLTLPKEISAFRTVFCQNFNPVDVETGTRSNVDCSRIQSFKINNASSISDTGNALNIITPKKVLNITLNHDTYEGEGSDNWVSYCDSLEEMTDQGLCRYGEKGCSQGPETRLINGYKVYKDCWQYRQQYICRMVKDECSPLRAVGCVQTDSKCKEMRQGRCWIYEQTYHCPNETVQNPKTSTSSSGIFCLTGNCQDSSYKANGEMLEVISRLAMLKEVQDDIRAQQLNGSFQIFKGKDKYCSRNCVDFKDCCGGKKGWGVALALAMCTGEEKELAKSREQNLCHRIGSYCSKKVLGVCVTKKTSFCCFGTKFSRLLQEQGRTQLGLDWGTAKCPNCRGLTVEELSKIDFSKLDMREVFDEMMRKYKQPDYQILQQKTSDKIQENIKNIEKGLGNKKPSSKSGVVDGTKSEL
jgi:type-F conjugative transfer system mating-pair stabilization protein TraN